jgi:hypothetical protein
LSHVLATSLGVLLPQLVIITTTATSDTKERRYFFIYFI